MDGVGLGQCALFDGHPDVPSLPCHDCRPDEGKGCEGSSRVANYNQFDAIIEFHAV